MPWQYLLLIPTTIFHLISSLRSRKTLSPPGKLIDLGGYKVHLWIKGTGKTTVVLDHSLGGIEGYFLMDAIATKTRVCIYDRPGYGYHHWITMARELINLNQSSRQVKVASNLGILPIISIKSQTFFKPSLFTFLLPLKAIDRLRDKMHLHLSQLSDNFSELSAANSSHFVWTDEPEIILQAIADLLDHQ